MSGRQETGGSGTDPVDHEIWGGAAIPPCRHRRPSADRPGRLRH